MRRERGEGVNLSFDVTLCLFYLLYIFCLVCSFELHLRYVLGLLLYLCCYESEKKKIIHAFGIRNILFLIILDW